MSVFDYEVLYAKYRREEKYDMEPAPEPSPEDIRRASEAVSRAIREIESKKPIPARVAHERVLTAAAMSFANLDVDIEIKKYRTHLTVVFTASVFVLSDYYAAAFGNFVREFDEISISLDKKGDVRINLDYSFC